MRRLLVEPPGPHLCRRATTAGLADLSNSPVRQAALVAATALAVTSSGETVLLAVLLGVAAADVIAAAVALVATVALAVRWGSTSLDAIAGAQSVLGPGAAVGSVTAVVAAWSGAAALVLAAPSGWPAVAFAAAAALGVAGPAPGGPGDVAVRVAGTAAALAGVLTVGRRLGRRPARAAAAVLAAAALALALVSAS